MNIETNPDGNIQLNLTAHEAALVAAAITTTLVVTQGRPLPDLQIVFIPKFEDFLKSLTAMLSTADSNKIDSKSEKAQEVLTNNLRAVANISEALLVHAIPLMEAQTNAND